MPYASVDNFIASYDVRMICKELSDTGTPIAAGDLAANTTLLQLLNEASDIILASCLVGKRYSADDLTTLAASATGGFLLRRLCSDLAYGMLVSRRGRAASDVAKLAPAFVQVHSLYLPQLRAGEILFPSVADELYSDAGTPSLVDLTAYNPNTPSNLYTTLIGTRLFPVNVVLPPQ